MPDPKLRCSLLVLAVVALRGALSSAAEVEAPSRDLRREPVVQGNVKAGAGKTAVCAACHGADGHAIAPVFPNLAGQSAAYLYVQLRSFKEGIRASDLMRQLLEPLSDQDMKDLSAHYASLPAAAPAAAAATGDAERGRRLFAIGDSAGGVPPCQACHGVEGRGPDVAAAEQNAVAGRPPTAWHTYPVLADQQAAYVVAQLQAFKAGARGGTTNARIMQSVVRNLDEPAMQDLAAYLSQSVSWQVTPEQ